MNRSLWYVSVVALLASSLAVVGPSFASGGTTSGGVNSGGVNSGGSATGGSAAGGSATGGSATGSKKTTAAPTYSSIALGVAYYSPVTAIGSATFGYTADGSYKSLEINLSNLDYEDGTELPVELYMTRPNPVAYYGTESYTSSGVIVVEGGAAHLYVSTANGDVVPDFPLPGVGMTYLYVMDPSGATLLNGTFGAQAKKKGSTDVSP